MTQHEIIPMLIGFGLVILFGLLIYYIRHLQNLNAKERAGLLIEIENVKTSHENMHVAMQDAVEQKKVALESLADTKRLLDLELQDRAQHEAIIDQQNAMILELKDMVKNLIEKGKELDYAIYGNRPFWTIGLNDAILCQTEDDRNSILNMFEKLEATWTGGKMIKDHQPEVPCVIFYSVKHNQIAYWPLKNGKEILENKVVIHASDFLPVEQMPAEVQPTKETRPDDAHVGEQAQPSRDWSVPQAFPVCYKVPKGVQVVVVEDGRAIDDDYYRKPGLKGVTTESSDLPFCDWEDGKEQICMESCELAPLNPTDHPEHPQFKGKI